MHQRNENLLKYVLFWANTNVTVLVLTQRGIQPTNVSSTTFKTITKDIRETVLMDLTTHVKCYTGI
jgi:hypothetical protein